MTEYLANGARLGFLVYPHKRQVWIYRPNEEPQCLEGPASVPADPELPGFILDLTEIWR
jgi:Uma2 family endonuclease